MAWVFDVSVVLTWCFDDEHTREGEALLERLKTEPAIVPQLWHLELANVLTQAMRRRPAPRITDAGRAEFLQMLSAANIKVDSLTTAFAWTNTLELADKYKLSTYDAAYLELAMREGVDLATLDKELRKAGVSSGVNVIP